MPTYRYRPLGPEGYVAIATNPKPGVWVPDASGKPWADDSDSTYARHDWHSRYSYTLDQNGVVRSATFNGTSRVNRWDGLPDNFLVGKKLTAVRIVVRASFSGDPAWSTDRASAPYRMPTFSAAATTYNQGDGVGPVLWGEWERGWFIPNDGVIRTYSADYHKPAEEPIRGNVPAESLLTLADALATGAMTFVVRGQSAWLEQNLLGTFRFHECWLDIDYESDARYGWGVLLT